MDTNAHIRSEHLITRELLLEAALLAFVWLASNVASMFGIISNHPTRYRHTNAEGEDQLPALYDITRETPIAEKHRRISPTAHAELHAKRASVEG